MLRDPEGKCHYLTSARGELPGLQPGEGMAEYRKQACRKRNLSNLCSLLPGEDHKPQTLGPGPGPRITPGDPRVLHAEHEYLCLLSKMTSSHAAASFKDFHRKSLTEGVPHPSGAGSRAGASSCKVPKASP